MTCFVIYLANHTAKTNKQRRHVGNNWAIVSWRDTFEFDQGDVTKNQPITALLLLSESLAI